MKELEALKNHIRSIGPAQTRFVVNRSMSKTRLFVSYSVTHTNADKHDLVDSSNIQCYTDGSVDADATLNGALRLAALRLDTWIARSSICKQHRRKGAYKLLVMDIAKIFNHVGIIRNDDVSMEILLRTFKAMNNNELSWDGVLKSISMIKERLATKSLVFG